MKKTIFFRYKHLIIGLITILIIGIVFLILKYVQITPNQSPQITSNKISVVIVPHFDLAKESRTKALKEVSSSANYKTVVLVSPDHFEAAESQIVTTEKDWKLNNAIIYPDKAKIDTLISSGLIQDQESAFNREHGIANILPDIANSFSNARIIPIMISQAALSDKITTLNTKLNEICKTDCLLVSSVDFSHYLPGALAEIHDAYSIRALTNLDEAAIVKAEVDSPQSLLLAILWAKAHQTEKFHLEENNNSGKLTDSPDIETTSYVIGWFNNGDTKKITDEATFMFGGDMMFGRYIAYKYKNDATAAVKNLGERLFWGTDAAVVNLEGPISAISVPYNIDPENLSFNFPPQVTKALQWLHLDGVSLANNHTLNAGFAGLKNTQKVL